MKTFLIIIISSLTTLAVSTAMLAAPPPRSNATISFDCQIVMQSGREIEVIDCEITGLVPRRSSLTNN